MLCSESCARGISCKNVDVIYFMARSFDKTGNKEKAKKYYQHIIDNYPDNNRASEAKSKLKEIS